MLCALSCTPAQPSVPPADLVRLRVHLSGPERAGLSARLLPPQDTVDGGVVIPVRLPVWPGFEAHGALLRPAEPTGAGVVVAQGHFGEGKSSPEAQEIALQLVQRGVTVVLVDTPGMEEAAGPSRAIHFDEGAHNRAFLVAGGTSAMALQLEQLRAGLDLLVAEGATTLGATGASGGAVQSLYLALTDDRVSAVVLASFPPTPREARAGGCACDQIPGWPGPDPSVAAALSVPSLWLRDGEGPPPKGLPAQGTYVQTEGPHSYTQEMQAAALDFFADHLPLRPAPSTAELAPVRVRPISAGPLTTDDRSIQSLAPMLTPKTRFVPGATGDGQHELSCTGKGPAVVVAGGQPVDRAALNAAGFRACLVRIPEDAAGHHEAVGRGGDPYVHQLSGALRAAGARVDAVAAWGVRGHGLVAAGTGLPYVVRDPVATLQAVDPSQDAPWIHVPGAWWGALSPVWEAAVATGSDAPALAQALHAATTAGATAP